MGLTGMCMGMGMSRRKFWREKKMHWLLRHCMWLKSQNISKSC